jgi:tetratricopeptide (TPR) repeat protein
MLAVTHVLLGYGQFTVNPESEYESADRHARRAIALEPKLAEARAAMGLVKLFRDMNVTGARRELEEARELDPNFAAARQWLAEVLTMQGEGPAAIDEVQEAMKIDSSLVVSAAYAQVLFHAGDFPRAVEQARETIAMRDNRCRIEGESEAPLFRARVVEARALALGKEEAAARESMDRALELCTRPPPHVPGETCTLRGPELELVRATVLAASRPAAADSLAGCVRHMYKRLPAWHLAVFEATRGRMAEARAWLDSACVHRDRYVLYVRAEPAFRTFPTDTLQSIQQGCRRR